MLAVVVHLTHEMEKSILIILGQSRYVVKTKKECSLAHIILMLVSLHLHACLFLLIEEFLEENHEIIQTVRAF